jgi:hypothetical protein
MALAMRWCPVERRRHIGLGAGSPCGAGGVRRLLERSYGTPYFFSRIMRPAGAC